jgi:type I restriction enzyme S subunit
MPGLNMALIKELRIPLPPLSLQQEFARRVEEIEQLKTTHRESLAQLDALFASLQHRTFRGEL